jgi:hypothetical protein
MKLSVIPVLRSCCWLLEKGADRYGTPERKETIRTPIGA